MSSRIAVTEQTLKKGESGVSPSIPLMRNLDSEALGLGVMGRAQGLGAAGVITHGSPVSLPPIPGANGASAASDAFKSISLPKIPSMETQGSSQGQGAARSSLSQGESFTSAPISAPIARQGNSDFSELSFPATSAKGSLGPTNQSAPSPVPLTTPPTPFENITPPSSQIGANSATSSERSPISEAFQDISKNAASGFDTAANSALGGAANLGNLLADTKKGINPILQFGKEIVKLISGSMMAFVNFLFKSGKA